MKNPKTNKPSLTRQQTKLERRAKRLYALAACFLLAVTALAVPALAADDPLAVVQKLSDFIFSLIRAVGLILLGYGILQSSSCAVGWTMERNGSMASSGRPARGVRGMITVATGLRIPPGAGPVGRSAALKSC